MNSGFRKYSFYRLILVIPAMLLLVSCVEEMELPEGFYQERMVVNSVLDPDSLVRINVARSMPPTGKVEFEFIEDADIRMGLNGAQEIMEFAYSNNGWYEDLSGIVDPGSGYFLEVNAPGMPAITSLVSIPEKPVVSDVRLHGDSISFRISDNPDDSNYYIVRTCAWQMVHYSYELEDGSWTGGYDTLYRLKDTESDLEFIEAWYSGRYGWINSLTGFTFDDEFWSVDPDFVADSYLFSDILFDGQSIDFHMDISYGLDWVIGDPPAIDVFIHSIDENYYRYLLTLAQYLTTDGTPFTDRAKIHNNVQGGYGIFGAQNGVCIKVILPNLTP
jgi:hypothetical protein